MCDTFIALPPATSDGSIIFGKNSDREPGESQALEYYPPASYTTDSILQCTYLTIPQVKHTHGILLSRPFWMWGGEIGANDHGVVIGNEAVWTRMHLSRSPGLLGMDLLRLALERGATAQAALEVMIQLLADYGQGGPAGYRDKKMAYHNSYIIADPTEAWVFETAGQLWAAKRVQEYYSISNGLTIGTDFDMAHHALIPAAQAKGWLKKGHEFNFARCYGDWFYTTFSACRVRQEATRTSLNNGHGKFSVASAFATLRDHAEPNYHPDSHLLGNRVCAHAANPIARSASQSTASLVAHLTPERQTFWGTGTSAPCLGTFKPIRLHGQVAGVLGPAPGASFDPETLWWRHEQLHREVLKDFKLRSELIRPGRDQWEQGLLDQVEQAGEDEINSISKTAFADNITKIDSWVEQVRNEPVKQKPGFIYRNYWRSQNELSGLNHTLIVE